MRFAVAALVTVVALAAFVFGAGLLETRDVRETIEVFPKVFGIVVLVLLGSGILALAMTALWTWAT